MALPSSGQISFNDVRVETSQSSMSDYYMGYWTMGYNGGNIFGSATTQYAPINVLSSGSRFTESTPLNKSNLSMSAWYGYNHTLTIPAEVTGTLYSHASYNTTTGGECYPRTMLIMELGVLNTTYSINISGSVSQVTNVSNPRLYVVYGTPWSNNGTSAYSSSVTIVKDYFLTSSSPPSLVDSFTYNYTYNAASGSKLYFILSDFCYSP